MNAFKNIGAFFKNTVLIFLGLGLWIGFFMGIQFIGYILVIPIVLGALAVIGYWIFRVFKGIWQLITEIYSEVKIRQKV